MKVNMGHVVGPQGNTGIQGERGPQGEQGIQGPKGDTGKGVETLESEYAATLVQSIDLVDLINGEII